MKQKTLVLAAVGVVAGLAGDCSARNEPLLQCRPVSGRELRAIISLVLLQTGQTAAVQRRSLEILFVLTPDQQEIRV